MATAILLASMGGPDSLQAVRPFLFNLFKDEAILRVPFLIRLPLAGLISFIRCKKAQDNYALMGGSSPLLKNTREQAKALEAALKGQGDFKCFVGMSYWKPFIEDAVKQMKEEQPQRVIIVPMYPQYSTTTSASVIRRARKSLQKHGLSATIGVMESFYDEDGFIEATIEKLKPVYDRACCYGTPQVLFSAHGLPESIVKKGDPYPEQCQITARAIKEKSGIDGRLCYQSKVGPSRWIGPATDHEIEKASLSGRPVVVVPIAFVSEHSETLVELGVDYRDLARKKGCPFYDVVETVGCSPVFINGLAQKLVQINQNCNEIVENSK
jgi:ferrochelatase